MITSVMFFPLWFYWTVDTPQTWMTEVYRGVLVYVVFRRLGVWGDSHMRVFGGKD